MKCKICNRAKATCIYNGIDCCMFCQFVLKTQNKINGYFINNMINQSSTKTGKENMVNVLVNQYPEILINHKISKTTLEEIRKDIIFNYKKICLKEHKD
jgi:hypothetical protein